MPYVVRLLLKEFVTHDTKRFIVERPEDYQFKPGQATRVAINQPEWKEETRPLTIANQPEDKVLEFIVKGYPRDQYPDHEGMTERLHQLKPGDELLIGDPWGTIQFKQPGTFIAGGAGITPFISILRRLRDEGKIEGNRLMYSNKRQEDIILEREWRDMFEEDDLVLALTKERVEGYEHGRIDKAMLEEYVTDFSQHFYICGSPPMVADLKKVLQELGANLEAIVFEE
jgi:ferredoxin-NADP reductase